jgi:hypothetical protein
MLDSGRYRRSILLRRRRGLSRCACDDKHKPFADHNVLGVFTGLTKLVVPIAFYALGSLVCVVQAFVFVLLAMIYVVYESISRTMATP